MSEQSTVLNLNCSAESLKQWHLGADAFERLIPPWTPIRLLSRDPQVPLDGKMIFQVGANPFAIRWVAEHETLDDGFVDTQTQGPFKFYRHEHRFIAKGNQSYLIDNISWKLPALATLFSFPWLEHWAQKEFQKLFQYRHHITRADLDSPWRLSQQTQKRILVTGATGLVGKRLVAKLRLLGEEVWTVGRLTSSQCQSSKDSLHLSWDELEQRACELPRFDAVIHLAGASIADKRWTTKRKQILYASRVKLTYRLGKILSQCKEAPALLVAASASGIYGSKDAHVTENSEIGTGYLAELCQDWERSSTTVANNWKARLVILRLGLVIAGNGGIAKKLKLPYQLGLAGKLGSGEQWYSWIGLEDLLRIIDASICDLQFAGIYNAVQPTQPSVAINHGKGTLKQRDFAQIFAKILRRPAILHLPSWLLKLLLGELAEALCSGAPLLPKRLEDASFPFLATNLEQELRREFGKT